MEKIYFSRIRDVKFPERGTIESAGIDFYVPVFTTSFLNYLNSKNIVNYDFEKKLIRLSPNDRINIPSGIKCKIEKNTALIAFNKSGISTKLGLASLACVVDSDYQGEIHISLVNISNTIVEITENQKIIQFISIPINLPEIFEIEQEKLYSNETERGEKGFGSTGI